MCLDCGCFLPANEHNDSRHITYQNYQKGDRPNSDTVAVNGKSMPWVNKNIKATLNAIDAGKISPRKRR